MVTRRQIEKLAGTLGVAVDFCFDRAPRGAAFHEIILTAPDGFRFRGTGLHENVVASQVDGLPMTKLYPDVLDDLQGGIEPCTEPDCEWCKGE